MTLRTNNAEGGTAGASAVAGTTGGTSGTAFDATSTSPFPTFSSAQAAHGTLSYRFVTSGGAQVAWNMPGGTTKYAARMYVQFNAAPPSFVYLISPSGVSSAKFRIDTGKFAISDQNGTIVATFPTAIATGVWYRLELEVDASAGFSTANGYLAARYFIGDATTPVDSPYSSNTVPVASAAIPTIQFGPSTVFAAIDMWADDLALADGTTTPLGPAVPAAVPFAGWGIPL